MQLDEAIRRRRMCRSFRSDPVPPEVVDRLIDRARRAPSAGNSQGWAFVVLEGPDQTRPFWQRTADQGWLAAPTWPGLVRAPVIIVPLASRDAYLSRYREADKVGAGRESEAGWPLPYWLLDTAMATQLLLLGAVVEGLGALLFALHGDTAALLRYLGVPSGWEPIGAVALGWPDGEDRPATSASRGRRSAAEVTHRGRW